MSEPTGTYWMRFVCDENGKLLKNAPGNYKCGERYKQPYRMSKFPFWELLETPAVLTAPLLMGSDNVFEDDVIYVPDDPEENEEKEDVAEAATVEMTPARIMEDSGVNVDPSAPATIEPYMRYNTGTGKLSPSTVTTSGGEYVVESKEEPVEETIEESEEDAVNADELDRDELKQFLDDAGVLYKEKTRTSTLKKMVDELVNKE